MAAIINMFPLPKFKGKGFILPKKRRIPRKTKKAMNKNLYSLIKPKPYKIDNEAIKIINSLRGKSLKITSKQTIFDGSILYTFDLL